MDQIGGDHLDRLGDPIAFGKAFRDLVEGSAVEAELRRHRILLARDSLFATALLVTATQHFFGRIVEFGEQLALPAVPYARPDRTNIDDGQHEQQAEARSEENTSELQSLMGNSY